MNVKNTVLVLVGLCVIVYGVSVYVEDQKRDTVNKILVEVAEQEATLISIAEITDRNGADEVVESIIKDCNGENRTKFDDHLNRLGALSHSELQETQKLFDACARFHASRKAVMVARMEREYEVYKNLVELLAIVDDAITVSNYDVARWGSLVDLEKKRSDIFNEQVGVQQNIISALTNGESVGSENIQKMLAKAQNINEEAVVVNQQIDSMRAELLDI